MFRDGEALGVHQGKWHVDFMQELTSSPSFMRFLADTEMMTIFSVLRIVRDFGSCTVKLFVIMTLKERKNRDVSVNFVCDSAPDA